MSENQNTLVFDHVSKIFPKTDDRGVLTAVENFDITIANGEFVAIVGTSGCGKTTILRMIAGLITPTNGTVTLNGVPITKPDPQRGMVFQKPTLFPWMSAKKNIAFSSKVRGKASRSDREKAERMLQMVGMEEFGNDYPHQLSGGMAQRVALARTLINEPEILLLDEPLSALDAFTRMNMQDEVLSICESKKQMVVMVTHDVDEAIYMATRVLVMKPHPGRLLCDIAIELEYPRDRSSVEFVRYRNQILEMLDYNKQKTSVAGRGL